MNIIQRIKDNKAYLFGLVVGLVVVVLSLWILDKIIAWAFNGGINVSTVFNLNNGFIILSLLALVGIAYLLYRGVLIILWIVERIINHRTYHQSSDNSKPQ